MNRLLPLFDNAFAPSACFVLDEERLVANAAVLDDVQQRSGARILLALKGYAAWATFPLLSRFAGSGPLWGVCASSVDEARLGREEFGGEVHAFAAAWNEEEVDELLELVDHLVFNSLAQWRRFGPRVAAYNAAHRPERPIDCGLRLNPEHSEGAAAVYNPCSPGSRLGIRPRQMEPAAMEGIAGLHFHTLCEQGADALARTLTAVEAHFGQYLPACSWINFGGGHHITRQGYDLGVLCRCVSDWQARYQARIYLEPGEAVALDAGWLTATVLDVVMADMPVAVLDVSAACHMPDVLEMPYCPPLYCQDATGRVCRVRQAGDAAAGSRPQPHVCRLAGKSCLAGDVIGEYAFPEPLQPGQRLLFGDMAIYSMVKTTTFNGLRLPAIALWQADSGLRLLRRFGYEDFKTRLG